MSETSGLLAPLEDWPCSRLPSATKLRVRALRKPGAGEPSDTQRFELDYESEGHEQHADAVLRCAPPSPNPAQEDTHP